MRNRPLAITCACLLGIVTAACGGDSRGPSPQPAPQSRSSYDAATGGPRLAWDQFAPSNEELRRYSYVLYVDGTLVPLPDAACGTLASETLQSACTSPLPALTTGQHTLEMATRVTENGVVIESARSAPLAYTVGGSSVSSVTEGARASGWAGARSASLHLETVVSTSDGVAYAVDIVAAGVKGPAQLASAQDGRLFVAGADGRVRVIRPDERHTDVRSRGAGDRGDGGGPGDLALDGRALLDPPPVGPMSIALHPDFAQNQFVYVSFLAQGVRERPALRVIRLRDVGGTLGEAATLFEAPLAVDAASAGPRLAFGPDGLLYVALPPGAWFHGEPAASVPQPSMLRLRDDGRVPLELPALEGVPASPIGFDWHPTTGALWAAFPDQGGDVVLRPLTAAGATAAVEAGRVTLRAAAGGSRAMGALRFQPVLDDRDGPARAFVALPRLDALTVMTCTVPSRLESLLGGMFGPISDLATGPGGTLHLAAEGRELTGGADGGVSGGVVVRLTPRPR